MLGFFEAEIYIREASRDILILSRVSSILSCRSARAWIYEGIRRLSASQVQRKRQQNHFFWILQGFRPLRGRVDLTV